MSKVDRLRKEVEPFATLFWALGNVLASQHLTEGLIFFNFSWG